MSGKDPIPQVLAYEGVKASSPPNLFKAKRDPRTNEKGVRLGDFWLNTVTQDCFQLVGTTSGNQVWDLGGNAHATTTEYGIVILNDSVTMAGATNDQVPTALAIKTYVDNVVIIGAPVADEVTLGIGYVASDANAVAQTPNVPGVSAYFLTPTNLNPIFASAPPIGGTTPAAGVFTDLTADGTGAVSLGSNAAADFTVTGAFDLTLTSTAGSIPISAGEAVADAISLQAAAGGLDVDTALLLSLVSARNNAQAIQIEATLGGIDILASGASAGEDIDIVATGSSVNITSTENVADSIVMTSTVGGIQILATGASAGEDILLTATGSSVGISATEAVADAIKLNATAGGVQVTGAGQIKLDSSQNAGDAILLTASAGGIDILATGAAAGEDIDITASSSINITSTEDAALAIYLHANGGTSETIRLRSDQGTGANSIDILSDVGGVTIAGGLGTADAVNITASTAGGGIDIDASTGGVIVDTTGVISLDSAMASNFTITGAADLTLQSTAGSALLFGGEAAVDAVTITATNVAGGIDINAGTGGITIDTTAAISIDSATASNLTVTGAGQDLTLSSVGGSVLIESTEDAALAIRLHANGGTSETIQIHSDQGTGVASVGLLSDVGGITLRATGLASADAINIEAPAGGLDVDVALQMNLTSSQNAIDAIRILSSAGGIDIDAVGAATEDINITNTGGSVVIAATEAIADAITLSASAGGIDITSAGAGLDIDLLATGGSINVTATQAAADAIVLNASNAAGGIDISTGGGSIDLSSSGFVTVAPATDTVASPTAASTLNVNVGAATFTGFTTASAASQVFTITNSIATTSSVIFVSVMNEGANDAQLTITRVKRSAGAFEVTVKNNGAAALNGNVTVAFWIIKV